MLVLTGAGVSAESGVPTFRGGGNTAVWKGMPFDVISSGADGRTGSAAVWEWFDYRRDFMDGHRTQCRRITKSRDWQERFAEFTLVTQNIDGLHQKAGSRDVIELHGNIWRARCTVCRFSHDILVRSEASRCMSRVRRPLAADVVLFGEMLPPGAFEFAAERASRVRAMFCDWHVALVYPAAGLPEIAKAAGAFVCEVNPERTPLSDFCDEVLTGKAGEFCHLFSTMKTLYFDCFAGASGDMILGAMVAAGVDPDYLREQLSLLRVDGFNIDFETVDRSGMSATYARVETAHEHKHRHLSDIKQIIEGSGLSES